MMHKFLIIQTSFIGDVVLATAVVEKLHQQYPNATLDFLLRNGNESLLKGHPLIRKVLVWNKSTSKNKNLLKLIQEVRSEHYTHLINLHRFASTGFISLLSGAKYKAGFDKNPFSFCYNKKVKHVISEPFALHPIAETERNQRVIADLTDETPAFPALYPTQEDYARIRSLQGQPYICIAPASVWFTKQFPVQKWIALIDQLPSDHKVFLLGGRGDEQLAKSIISNSQHRNLSSLCGALSFLQSAALMQLSVMNYVNDSGPLHFASAVNAPVTAIFCSTVPAFGFGPLRDNGRVVEIKEKLYCRPCGLHGHKACPEGHFRCALDIETKQLLWWTSNQIS